MRYGIIGAMPEEVENIKNSMTISNSSEIGGKVFIAGSLCEKDIVLACSGIGKVSAALTATLLLGCFNCDMLINVGIGGGLQSFLKPLDVVIASELLQYDFDLSAFGCKIGQVPGHPSVLQTDENILNTAISSIRDKPFSLYKGLIVSGDKFVTDKDSLTLIFPDALATEMEGAAIAQVAYDFKKPFLVIRTVSDGADNTADMTYEQFKITASRNSQILLIEILQKL